MSFETVFFTAVAFGLGYLARIVQEWNKDECPRVIYGYNCKGEGCDHSEAAIAEARWNMERK